MTLDTKKHIALLEFIRRKATERAYRVRSVRPSGFGPIAGTIAHCRRRCL